MDVNCEGCAGCCVDWRALTDLPDPEREVPRQPVDDAYNLVPLEIDEVRGLIDAGLGDVLTPRVFRVTDPDAEGTVEIDGEPLAAIRGRPAFYVGLCTPPKPVAPAGREDPRWLPTCVFLDPTTLQCRIHDGPLYPNACSAYPGANLSLDQETECERVERAGGGDRLLDATPPSEVPGLRLGPQAVGAKLFAHPDPDDLGGRIERIADGRPTAEDRATFAAAAAASSPGTVSIDRRRFESVKRTVLDADSWGGQAIDEWTDVAGPIGTADGNCTPSLAKRFEDDHGAPGTPGWE